MASYDLLAEGKMDKLVKSPEGATLWRKNNRRNAPFSVETVAQHFQTSVSFGGESQCAINRQGDLIYTMYLRVDLPALDTCTGTEGNFPVYSPPDEVDKESLKAFLPAGTSIDDEQALKDAKDKYRKSLGFGRDIGCCSEGSSDSPEQVCDELGDEWAHYTNSVGHMMIKEAVLQIGSNAVDKLWGTFMFVWEELTGKSGRRLVELVGRRWTRAALVCDALTARTTFTPLPFYFSESTGSALPLASLQFHQVTVHIDFEPLQKLIVVSKPGLTVKDAAGSACLGLNQQIKAQIDVAFVLLAPEERVRFQNNSFEQVIVTTQRYEESKVAANEIIVPLSFNHAVREIIFMVRRNAHASSASWTNFSGAMGMDPVITANLTLNNTSRFGEKSALFMRAVTPMERHTCIPDGYIYCLCFAVNPETLDYSGSCNMSRIDNIQLHLKMQTAIHGETVSVIAFARSFNVLQFQGGMSGLKYG